VKELRGNIADCVWSVDQTEHEAPTKGLVPAPKEALERLMRDSGKIEVYYDDTDDDTAAHYFEARVVMVDRKEGVWMLGYLDQRGDVREVEEVEDLGELHSRTRIPAKSLEAFLRQTANGNTKRSGASKGGRGRQSQGDGNAARNKTKKGRANNDRAEFSVGDRLEIEYEETLYEATVEGLNGRKLNVKYVQDGSVEEDVEPSRVKRRL